MSRTRPIYALAIASAMGIARPAAAWDPTTTHAGITERAAIDGELHGRWMEQSARLRGIFTPLRIDPARLDPETRRILTLAMRRAHADMGAVAAGGPGACPGLDAPPATRARCVEGDLWETTALGWIRVGIALEAVPATRLLHHFVDARAPAASTWRTRNLSRAFVRRAVRRAGGSLAASATRTGFATGGTSAAGWIFESDDPFAPRTMRIHLERAALSPEPAARDHHFALALIGLGALQHVAQDLALPAHARGDLAALFVPLSPSLGDRGSPLAEYARVVFARRGLPSPLLEARAPSGGFTPPTDDLLGLLFGPNGLARFTASRHLSEGTLPRARAIDPDQDGRSAATQLLAHADHGLSNAETNGAYLAPWPADDGYLRNPAGRALAAWSRGTDGRVTLYLDRRVLRDQALGLLPVATSAATGLFDLIFPAWPSASFDAATNRYVISPPSGTRSAEVIVASDGPDRVRALHRRVVLRSADDSAIDRVVPDGVKPEAVVLVLSGIRTDGSGFTIEQRLIRPEPPAPAQARPRPAPPAPEAEPTTVDPLAEDDEVDADDEVDDDDADDASPEPTPVDPPK